MPARGLPGHGDVVRVPAEGRDVAVRPAQGLELIQQPGVGLAGAGVAEVAEQPQPVGHADHDHALLPHQPARIVVREVPGAAGVGAAVDPQQHRPVRALILRPGDAQPLAVLVEAEGDQPLVGVLVALGAGRGGGVRGEGLLRSGLRVGEGRGGGEALGLGVPDAPGPHDAVLAHRAEGACGCGDDLPGEKMLRGVGHGPSLSGPGRTHADPSAPCVGSGWLPPSSRRTGGASGSRSRGSRVGASRSAWRQRRSGTQAASPSPVSCGRRVPPVPRWGLALIAATGKPRSAAMRNPWGPGRCLPCCVSPYGMPWAVCCQLSGVEAVRGLSGPARALLRGQRSCALPSAGGIGPVDQPPPVSHRPRARGRPEHEMS